MTNYHVKIHGTDRAAMADSACGRFRPSSIAIGQSSTPQTSTYGPGLHGRVRWRRRLVLAVSAVLAAGGLLLPLGGSALARQGACGDGVFAGPSTSCPFAKNVHNAYFAVPGDSVEVNAYSPATGKIYRMNCVKTGAAVTCRGGNEAVVTFSA
jgi:hypothetical protein